MSINRCNVPSLKPVHSTAPARLTTRATSSAIPSAFSWTKKARFSIQLKDDNIEEEVARVVRRAGAVEWTGFNEGTLQRLIDIRKFLPETYVFYDVGKKDVPVEDYIDVCRTNGFQELVMHHQYVTAEKCAKIRAAGILPGAWNIGDAEKMRQLLDMGVFRIYADAPLVMLDVVKEREKR